MYENARESIHYAYSTSLEDGFDFLKSFSIRGGTFYFDPTDYLDTDKYTATQTKDTDGVDIWVVTEK